MMINLPPGIFMLFGGILIPFLPSSFRPIWIIVILILSASSIFVDHGMHMIVEIIDYSFIFWRVILEYKVSS